MKHKWGKRTSALKSPGGQNIRRSWVECSWCRVSQTEKNKDEECRVRTEVKNNGGWVGRG